MSTEKKAKEPEKEHYNQAPSKPNAATAMQLEEAAYKHRGWLELQELSTSGKGKLTTQWCLGQVDKSQAVRLAEHAKIRYGDYWLCSSFWPKGL